jgi:putative ABC transport system permease protein
MSTPLVLLNLLHYKTRTLLAAAGVGFAVVLVFAQLGFYGSAEAAATSLLDRLDFDLVLTAGDYLNLLRPRSFPRGRLYQARAHPAVAAVAPLYLESAPWLVRGPGRDRRGILVVGLDPTDALFRAAEVFRDEPAAACLHRLREPDTVLVDTHTRPYFGPRDPGVETELGFTRVRVVGRFSVGAGYGADGMVLASDRTYAHVFGSAAPGRVSLGLIRLRPEERGRAAAVRDALARHLYAAAPRDEVRVLTRQELHDQERDYWVRRTSVGVIFLLGVAVACVVGVIFVYQVIATDVKNQLPEFATLKAIGYPQRYLSGVVLRQALVLAVLGYLPGLGVALGLYAVARAGADVPMFMTPGRAAGVFALALAMCALSGLLALHKVRAADPADLF